MTPQSPRAGRLTAAAPLFAALGDATRLGLVARLCEAGPQSIARLAGGFAVSRQAVTKHLRALQQQLLARTLGKRPFGQAHANSLTVSWPCGAHECRRYGRSVR